MVTEIIEEVPNLITLTDLKSQKFLYQLWWIGFFENFYALFQKVSNYSPGATAPKLMIQY